MRLVTAARRAVAVLAATALVSSGGLVSGAFVGTASAQGPLSVSPSGAPNTGVKTFTLTGTSFYPSTQDTVVVKHNPTVPGQQDYSVTPVDNSASCPGSLPIAVPNSDCGTSLDFQLDLTNAAPGSYDVTVIETGAGAASYTTTKVDAIRVASPGNPVVTSTKPYVGNGAPGQIEITGDNLSLGATVEFLLADSAGSPTTTVDPGMSFVPTVDGGPYGNGNISKTTLRGTYSYSTFTPGIHFVRVTNAASQTGTSTSTFYQPRINTVAPTALGQGASNVATTLAGAGFHPSSTVFVGAASGTAPAIDVTVSGSPSTNSAGALVSFPLSVTPAATTRARRIGVRGPDGGYYDVAGGLTVNASPKPTSASPNQLGQGAQSRNVAVTGTGFTGTTTFDFGPGIGQGVTASATSTVAQVTVNVAPDAALGGHVITATNTDSGTSSFTGALSVTSKPVVTAVNPPSGLRNASYAVDLTGTNFVSGATLSISGAGVTSSATTGSGNALHATFTVSNTADFGPHDITVTNPDFGTSTIVGGFGVNSMSVLTSAVTNGANQDITIQGMSTDQLDKNAPVLFMLPGSADQPELTGTFKSFDSALNRLTVTVPLKTSAAAAGFWTVKATAVSGAVSCTGCLQVLVAADPSGIAISPATGGRGAVGRVIMVTGTGLYRGQTATFGSGITTTSTQYVAGATPADPGSLKATISIDPNAPLGLHDVTVTNVGQPSSKGVKTGAFTVNAAPSVTSIDPNALGQGAQNVNVTVTGAGIVDGATASFGTGDVTGVSQAGTTATSLVTRVTVAPTASTTTARSVTVTNPDGGVGTSTTPLLTITAAPIINTLNPVGGKPGQVLTGVQFTGQNFVAKTTGSTTDEPIISIVGTTVTNEHVINATSMTADIAIASNAVPGKRGVVIENPDYGQSTLANGFAIATAPVAPTAVAAAVGNKVATITWDFPTAAGSDGGSPLTGFTIDDGDSATSAVTVGPATRTADLTGLKNGRFYAFTVKAVNAIGTGPAGTATGTPFGLPLAPATVVAGSQESQLLVAWTPADAQGKPITKYTVTSTNPAVPTVVVPGTQRFAVIKNLTNGTTYSFTVKATNSVGDSPFSAASAPVAPKYATTMNSLRSPVSPVSGSKVAFRGKLLLARTGAPLGGVPVVLTLKPQWGPTRTVSLKTDSRGIWGFTAAPTYNTVVYARYAGDATKAAFSAPTSLMVVATKVSVSSPSSGSASSSGSTLVVRGVLSPNKAGRTIYLVKVVNGRKYVVARVLAAKNSSYSFSVKLPRGTYVLAVTIGVSKANVAGSSGWFTVKRT